MPLFPVRPGVVLFCLFVLCSFVRSLSFSLECTGWRRAWAWRVLPDDGPAPTPSPTQNRAETELFMFIGPGPESRRGLVLSLT